MQETANLSQVGSIPICTSNMILTPLVEAQQRIVTLMRVREVVISVGSYPADRQFESGTRYQGPESLRDSKRQNRYARIYGIFPNSHSQQSRTIRTRMSRSGGSP